MCPTTRIYVQRIVGLEIVWDWILVIRAGYRSHFCTQFLCFLFFFYLYWNSNKKCNLYLCVEFRSCRNISIRLYKLIIINLTYSIKQVKPFNPNPLILCLFRESCKKLSILNVGIESYRDMSKRLYIYMSTLIQIIYLNR